MRGPPGLANTGSRTRKPESMEDVWGKRGHTWGVKCSPSKAILSKGLPAAS